MPKKKKIENYIIRDKLQEYLDAITQSHQAEPSIINRYKIVDRNEYVGKLLTTQRNILH